MPVKWLVLIILLLANVLYFGLELGRETGMAVQSVQALKIPATAQHLHLVSELTRPPDLRVQDRAPAQAPVADDGAPADEETPPDERAPADEGALRDELSEADSAPASVEGLIDELPEVEIASLEESMRRASCFRFGPIPEELQANGLSDWFTSRNAKTRIRSRAEQARQLFWIYLAPRQSRQSALALLDELKGRGIRDYRLISHGNLQNAISLGIFSSQAAMNNRLDELQQKGYKPIVIPYDNLRRIYWVDVQLRATQELLEQVFKGHPARYNSVPVDCSEMALASL